MNFSLCLYRFLSMAILLILVSNKATAAAYSINQLMGNSAAKEFQSANRPRTFIFPQDHGAHPDFQTEWWYFSGNLRSDNDPERLFGYQLTLFRYALQAPNNNNTMSEWRNNQVYMGHLAVSDIQHNKFYHRERFSRDALGLAGTRFNNLSEHRGFELWLEDWKVESVNNSSWLPVRIKAAAENFAVELLLDQAKPLVLQGDRGLSQKNHQPGNASYYYSFTRLPSSGFIRIDKNTIPVSGNSWLDREWSTSALTEDQQGWDWFALQLDDYREIMFYRLRDKAGRQSEYSAGIIVDPAGNKQILSANDVSFTVQRYWKSPSTGIQYPVAWSMSIPGNNLYLHISAAIDAQEWNTSVKYWEGAVSVKSSSADQSISGKGYLEMTGYGNKP